MIKLKEKSWLPEIIMITTLILNVIIFDHFNLFESMSFFELGICNDNCFGPFKAINNPIPWIFFFGIYILVIIIIFSFFIEHPKYRFKFFKK